MKSATINEVLSELKRLRKDIEEIRYAVLPVEMVSPSLKRKIKEKILRSDVKIGFKKLA